MRKVFAVLIVLLSLSAVFGQAFTDINAKLTEVDDGSAAWGDFDNDGDLDILFSDSQHLIKIIQNCEGEFIDSGLEFFDEEGYKAVFGDYDNDGDLDIICNGYYITKIYRNDRYTPNAVPSSPSNLSSSVNGSEVTLSWVKATDTETPQGGLAYNIYLGTWRDNISSASPMSNILTGYRKIVTKGNAGQSESWKINDLHDGKYYWSVQAVDNNFAGSQFADEQSFIVGTVLTTPVVPSALEETELTESSFKANWAQVYGAEGYYIDIAYDALFTNFVAGYENKDAENSLSLEVTGVNTVITYYYRVRAYNYAGTSGNSNVITAARTGSGTITVISPNGGEKMTRGGQFEIKWTDNITENVKIDLYKYNEFLDCITESTPSDGSFIWTIPLSLAGKYFSVRISSSEYGYIYDLSDDSFEILINSSDAQIAQELTYSWNSTTTDWQEHPSIKQYNYLSDGKVQSWKFMYWDDATSSYVINEKFTYNCTYYSDRYELKNIDNSNFWLYRVDTYKYDLKKALIGRFIFEHETISSMGSYIETNTNKSYHYYDGKLDNILDEVITEDDNDNQTYKGFITYFIYDVFERLISQNYHVYYPDYKSAGEMIERTNWTYFSGDNRRAEVLTEKKDGTLWINKSKRILDSDKSDRVRKDELINWTNGAWKESTVDSLYYYDDGKLRRKVNFYYSTSTSSYIKYKRIDYIYSVPSIFTSFTDMNIVLNESQLKYSTAEWGDYDNDGDQDLLVAGLYDSSPRTCLYKNNGNGSFTATNTGLPAIQKGSVVWGDYDNDGDLDILITGYDQSSRYISRIYRNNGNDNFTDINAAFAGVYNGSSDWGDYDNDGDLDIILTGMPTATTYSSKIYRNDGNGVFTDIAAPIQNVGFSSVAWSDYDNDGDLDVLITGTTGITNISKIYRNDNGSFTDVNAGLTGVKESSVAWGDYDNDSDQDILLTGYAGSSRISKIYRNDGSGVFTDISVGLTGVNLSSVDWGDYDNDGDLDILLTGFTGSAYISKVYQNNGYGAFADTNSVLTGICYGSAKWGDYDKDGDLDVFLVGMSPGSVIISKIYRNNSIVMNTQPTAPANLSSVLNEDGITFSWNKAADAQTPQDGLSYNLYIGAVSQGCQAVSPMSNISTGYRKIVSLGNAGSINSWTIKNLPFGKYYWSVQAIDNGYAGSLFSAEQTFVIDPFMETDSLLTGIYGSSSAWGDYDNDGDLDILMAGDTETGPVTKLYRNDLNGVFTEVSTGIQNMYLGSTAWGDYDNDGDLDILITGYTDTAYLSKIYRNDGSGVFTDINAGLTGCGYGTGIWGDYDNDGDLDILLTGYVNSTTKLSEIYRNDNGVFTDINAGLIIVSSSSAAWGDYDSDGDIDILLTGYSSTGAVSLIYRNDNGVFTNINAALTGVFKSSVAWGDYDNDGDLDILLTGMPTSTTYCSKVYRNDGSGVFTDIAAPIPNIGYSSVAWGDYNNDGYTDIFMCGYTGSVPVSKIFKNISGTLFSDSGVSLTGVRYSSIALGDMDNDNDLDILLSGTTGTEYVSKIYKNNITAVNTKPSTPANLSSVLNGSEMTLSWNKATDGQTPQNGLSYNLYIGTSPLTGNKKSPMSSISTGYRKVVSLGNAGSKNSYSIKNLPLGTYYWSVQAVDNAYAGSLFSGEQIFTIGSVPQNVSITYNAGQVQITWAAVSGAVSYKVFASADPFGTFADVSNLGGFSGTSWSQTVTGNKMFYYVVAVTAKEENINQSVKEEK